MSRWDPIAEMVEERDAVLVRVHLAGVRPEDIHIEATTGLLVICGERAFPHATFVRSFRLASGIEGESALAIMSDGVLTVRIPRRFADFAA